LVVLLFVQGSGKTLAFGIPIVHHILSEQETLQSQNSDDSDNESDSEAGDDCEPMAVDAAEAGSEQSSEEASKTVMSIRCIVL
jgi:superfamily II DNA/RNA helicase